MFPIGYIWLSFTGEYERNLGIKIQTNNKESYGFDLFVVPEYRKFSIGFELIRRWLKLSKESGKEKAMGIVANYNEPMLVALKLFGFKVKERIHSIEILKLKGITLKRKK